MPAAAGGTLPFRKKHKQCTPAKLGHAAAHGQLSSDSDGQLATDASLPLLDLGELVPATLVARPR